MLMMQQATKNQDLGDLKHGKEYQQRALEIRPDKLGPERFNVATSYHNFALTLQSLRWLQARSICNVL